MAASASSVQSIYTTRATTRVVGNKSGRNFVPSLSFSLHQQRNTNRVVRCSVEGQQSSELPKTTVTSSSSTTPVTPPPPAAQYTPPPPPPPPRAPKVSTKFSDVLAFSGPAPERINGRLAMIGFVAALGAELAQGDDVVAQLAHGGLPWFVGTSLVLSLASLIPLFKGVTVESKSDGVMTSSAELLNGRVAMLGLVALIFTEFVKGGALLYTHVQG